MIDIFAPQISRVTGDLAGKSLLLYGKNRLGKTKVSTSLPKPCYLAFEDGIHAINNVPFFMMEKWSDFTSFVKQITAKNNLERAKEMYQTIILDQLEAMGLLCEQYILARFGLDTLGAKRVGADGKLDYATSGYKELAKEFNRVFTALTKSGFTVIVIAHDTTRDFTDETGESYSKIYPKADKRIADIACDICDVIGYVSTNGLDDKGNEIPSSLYLKQTRKYHAGSRFPYMVGKLDVFSAQNLIAAMKEAVEKQEAAENFSAVSYEEQAQTRVVAPGPSFDELRDSIKEIALKMNEEGRGEDYRALVEKYLGKGKGVLDTTVEQAQVLEMILSDLHDLNV